ncbi:MAG: glycosyltransferase family 2 protein [Candidatus Bathyarchaeia archaeon]
MAEGHPDVSAIVPTYLEQETIAGCIQSIKKQNFNGKIETIVVDSHSPDRTREVAAAHADRVVDVKARGVGKARNVGAKLAQGDILLFVDADTYLAKHFVVELCRSFSDPRVVCVSGVLRGLERLGTLNNLFAIAHYGLLNQIATLSAHTPFPMFPSVCVAARKNAFQLAGGFVEDMAVGEDVTFSRKMGTIGKCVVNRKAVCYTSVRRISNCGKLQMYSMYFKNYVRIFLLKQKPWIQDFPHIRTE